MTELPPSLEPLITTTLHHYEAHLRAVLALERARHLHPEGQDDPALATDCKDHYEQLTKAKLALLKANRETQS